MHPTRSLAALTALAALSLASVTAPARAAVPFTFSGGGGTPLSITLVQPVTYTITASFPDFLGPDFIIQGTGDLFGDTFPAMTSSIGFTVDGGPVHTLQFMNSGRNVNSIQVGDIYTSIATPMDVPIGSIITLTPGTITTTGSIAATAPANGNYETWMTASQGIPISTNGQVPEPATLALLALPLLALRRSRRR